MSVPNSPARVCFVDTNVWLYAFISGSERNKSVAAQALINGETQIVVSTQVINELSVNLLKKAAFAEHQLRTLITSFYHRYPVVELDHTILVHASELRDRHRLSFWDGLVVSSALAAGAHVLYTEDMHDGLIVDGRLAITNPFTSSP